MSLRSRLLAPVTSALVGTLVAGLLVFAGTPAATAQPALDKAGTKREPDAVFQRSSYLCYGYADCRDKGMGNDGYARNNRTMYWQMYAGHNCTNYAAYRMVRSGLPNERPWSGGGNATYWGTSMPRITDDVPRVGAVTWWRANTGPAGSAGHVGYVERVVSKDEIVISQDSWGGDFSWAVVTRGSGNWPSGFIHFNDVPLVNRAAPTIEGIAKVGSVLRSTAGTWRPSDVDVRYQWYADGAKLRLSTHPSIRLTDARLGQRLTVTTTATKLGYPTRSATSAATAAVLPGQLLNQSAPTLSGEAKVDSTLTLNTGRWNPRPDDLTVQWFADGQPIEGVAADATELSLTPDLVGTTISATVTANRTGYQPVSADTAPTEPVAPGTFWITTPPSLLGTVELGQTLTVQAGGYQPTDATVEYQWLRDGAPIEGADESDYKVTNLDLGARISARVTLSRAGYTTTSVDSPATGVVKTTPRIGVRLERIRHRIRVVVTVTAPGVETVSGPVTVRIADVAKEVVLRPNGTAGVTLRGMEPGVRTLTVRYAGSHTVRRAVLTRDVRVQ